MSPTAEEAIKIIIQLSPVERTKVRQWIDETEERIETNDETKFRESLNWIEANRQQYEGEFVLLSGANLLAHSKNPQELYQKAREMGIKSPFVKRIKSKDLPFGGW